MGPREVLLEGQEAKRSNDDGSTNFSENVNLCS